jgi:predicted hydrocarbon binding protein
MHGIVFTEFHEYVQQNAPAGRWHEILHSAILDRHVYAATRHYPDKEFFDIVDAASKKMNTSTAEILEGFGEFIAPDLLGMYAARIESDWSTLDVIEHTETVIHAVVRVNQAGSDPPQLRAERVSPDEVELTYDSPRRLCHFAKGIIRGIAAHFGERIQVTERQCMLEGATECVLQIRRITANGS